uniref:HMG box domain-containing protein n=1 Tax=Steinernema glaseri TaxID=37863 RepID=A0A1I8AQK9_9BILA
MFWLAENRARVTKKAGVKWRMLTERTKWEKMSRKDKERYKREMVQFKNGTWTPPDNDKAPFRTGSNMARANAPTTRSAPERRTKKKEKKVAPKRGQSAYMFWLAENRARLTEPGKPVTEVTKKAGAEWRVLTERTKWEEMARKDKERYDREMAEFKNGTWTPPDNDKKKAEPANGGEPSQDE